MNDPINNDVRNNYIVTSFLLIVVVLGIGFAIDLLLYVIC